MRMIRRFEETVVELVNGGEIAGVTHECIGQEGVAAGVCAALEPNDVITSTHRGHGHVLAKGIEPQNMFAELLARVTGPNRGRGGSMHIADLSLGIFGANGIVGAGVPAAAGAAWAAKVAGESRIAVAFFGDGGLNQGVVLETLNLAAIWQLPVVFVCENNGYAVTMPASVATAGSATERAAAFGVPAESVDGMDAELVFGAANEAIITARSGLGPRFLECRTYRFVGHHTAERAMSLTYRSEDEIVQWMKRDPVEVVGRRLTADRRRAIDLDVEEIIQDAVGFARASPAPLPSEALEYVYASGLVPRSGSALK